MSRLRNHSTLSRGDGPQRRSSYSAPADGYCALTIARGDCSLSDSGTLEDNGAAGSLKACMQECLRGCPRCAVVSWSARNRDCSWYAWCDLSDLRRSPKNARDYVSVRVRRRPAQLASRWDPEHGSAAVHQLKIGIATTSAPDAHSACALVQWCERASLLARALRANGWGAQLLILSEPGLSKSECREAELAPIDPRLLHAIRRCQSMTPPSGDSHPRRMAPIAKFAAVSLQGFDWVVFADSDVSFVPEGDLRTAARRWAAMAPALLNASWPEFISNADGMSPVNGAVFIVRPSQRRYAQGLRILHRCQFNATHGWGLCGPPRSLGLRFSHPDGADLPLDGGDTGDAPGRTDGYKYNNWRFVGADSDQGFLFYLYHVLAHQAANFRWKANEHRALHWRGSQQVGLPKPWLLATQAPMDDDGLSKTSNLPPYYLARAYSYLSYSTTGLIDGGQRNATFCVRALWRFRRAIERDPRFDRLPDPQLVTMVPYVPLW